MKEVLSWIVENYKLLILIVACVLDIILFLVGMLKRKSDPSLLSVICKLPMMITHAEKVYGSGQGDAKFDCVLSCALNLYHSLTGVGVKDGSYVYRCIVEAIEDVLATPQKKGK